MAHAPPVESHQDEHRYQLLSTRGREAILISDQRGIQNRVAACNESFKRFGGHLMHWTPLWLDSCALDSYFALASHALVSPLAGAEVSGVFSVDGGTASVP